jgi:flagellar secretion chaperone FliS
MKNNHIARQYRELAIKGATPVGLIVLLYDMAIESLSQAVRELDRGDIEARTADLNHALSIIGELERSLNFEAGGDVAARLANFYNVARCKILEANIKSNKETIERLSGVLTSIREAWQVVERKTGGRGDLEQTQEAPLSLPAGSVPGQTDDERPTLRWSA